MADRAFNDRTSKRRRGLDLMTSLGRHELAILLTLVLIAGGIWGFVELAEEVVAGETNAFDRAIFLALRNPADLSDPLGPNWVEELGRDFTALGGVGVLTFLTLAVSGFLILQGKRQASMLVLVSITGGLLLSTLLKLAFDRPRPDLVPHETYVYTSSFPSGHSMMSAAAYLTLGALLARVQPRRATKAYLLILAGLLTLGVGISRIYLGVHWPTDVLAGWSLGATWAMFCWLTARWLQGRGQVEQDGEDPDDAVDAPPRVGTSVSKTPRTPSE